MDQTTDLTPFRDQYTYYSKRLLSDLGMGDVPQPERTQLLAAIENYVQQVMVNTLLENVTEEGAEEAEKVMNAGGSQEEVLTTLVSTMPNAELVIADALVKTYAEMLNDSRKLMAAISNLKHGPKADEAEATHAAPASVNSPSPTEPPMPAPVTQE